MTQHNTTSTADQITIFQINTQLLEGLQDPQARFAFNKACQKHIGENMQQVLPMEKKYAKY